MRYIWSKCLFTLFLAQCACTSGGSSANTYVPFEQPDDTKKVNAIIDVSYVQNLPPLQDIISKPNADVPVYGLYTWMGSWAGSEGEQILNVGISATRVGGANWIRRSESWATSGVRETFRVLAATNIEPMFTLSDRTRELFANGVYNEPDANGVPIVTPDFGNTVDDQAFINDHIAFMDEFLSEYGPNGTFWTANTDSDYHPPSGIKYKPVQFIEIWNEPNLHYLTGADYWDALDDQGKADLYAQLLIASYKHIHNNSDHPEWDAIKVVGVSACGVSHGAPEFVQYVHDKLVLYGGTANYYDVLSVHPYSHDVGPDTEEIRLDPNTGLINYHYSTVNDLKEVRDDMIAHGNGGKPVWFTEVGWMRYNGRYSPHAFSVTEPIQAAYVCRMYMMAMRTGVERVHIMFVTDADSTNTGFFDTSNSYSWYMQAYAVKNMMTLMPKPKIMESISDGASGYYAYKLQPNTDDPSAAPVIMAWNVEKGIVVELPSENGASYQIIDMLGNTKIVAATGTSLSVNIGPYPIYVVEQ